MISETLPLACRDDSTVVRLDPGQIRHAVLYAGGGGDAWGSAIAYREMGMKVALVAINHDQKAIATHRLNFPEPQHVHLCQSIDRVNPRHLYRDADLHALFASPSCVHFAAARGGAPVNPQLRTGSWQVVRWLRAAHPVVFWCENVPALEWWCRCRQKKDPRGIPLFLRNAGTAKKTSWKTCYAPGRTRPREMNVKQWWAKMETGHGLRPAFEPDTRYKGETFNKWLSHLRREGYDVEYRILNAADFGGPTSRLRLFVYGVRRGCGFKIMWPRPTRARPDEAGQVPAGLQPWAAARTIIDWDIHGTSIFERPVPLKRKTLARICCGLRKFGLAQYLAPGKNAAVTPSLRAYIAGADGPVRCGQPRPGELPLETVPNNDSGQLIQPWLQQPAEALPLQPFLVPGFSERKGQTPRTHDIEEPCPAICAQGHTHLTQPFLLKLRGTNDAADIELPAPTITAGGTHLGLVEPFLYQVNHGKSTETEPDGNRTQSVKSPLPTICGHRGEWALASSFLTQVSHGVGPKEKSTVNRRVKSLQNPVPALTASRDWAITSAFLLAQQSGGAPRKVEEPAPTIATAGAIGLVETTMTKSASTGTVIDLAEPGAMDQLETAIMHYALHPHNGRPRVGINGEIRELDIYHRMLNERELASATSFPPTYRFAGTKTDAIRQIGNAVPPYVARALIKAFWTQDENVGEPLAA